MPNTTFFGRPKIVSTCAQRERAQNTGQHTAGPGRAGPAEPKLS